MTKNHPVRKETYDYKHKIIQGEMDFIYIGTICIIEHRPESLYYDSIKQILLYLSFLR